MSYGNRRKNRRKVNVDYINDHDVNHIEILEVDNKNEPKGYKKQKETIENSKRNSTPLRKVSRVSRISDEESSNESDDEVFKKKSRKSVETKSDKKKEDKIEKTDKNYSTSVKKVSRRQKKIDEDSSDESDDSYKKDFRIKPVALFEEGDVSGTEIFGFQTPKRKNAMFEKAQLSSTKTTPISAKPSPKVEQKNVSPKSPSSVGFTPRNRRSILLNKSNNVENRTPGSIKTSENSSTKTPECTPKVRRSIMWNNSNIKETSSPRTKNRQSDMVDNEKYVPKTPYSLRTRLKTKIAAEVRRNVDGITSDDSDEYKSSSSDSEESESEEEKPSSSKPVQREYVVSSAKRKRKDLTYAIHADEYFTSTSGKKNKTSNHTLSKLTNPKINEEQLNKLLGLTNQYCTHKTALENLQKDCTLQQNFDRWCFSLREGFSILLYGLGSKKSILNKFCQKVLNDERFLVINGFFPGLTNKEIVDSLAELLNIKDMPTQLHEVVEVVEMKLSSKSTPPVFLVVHNLDGTMLQTDKAQSLLSRLASIPKCHLLSSIDHINAPLLWDDKKMSDFNFVWEDVTSYYSYIDETSFENSLMVKRSGSLVLISLKNVYQSLTKNGKEIFKILVEDHLANVKNSKYSGVGFSDLYWKCRDNFLVSTDLALRSQLTEFLDHQIVKWRKDSDQLMIPLETTILQQFHSLLEERET